MPGQNEEEKVGLLATRGRKIAAAIAAAFIASVGGGLGAWAFQAAKDKTTDVLDRSAPITVRVQRPGTFEPAWPGGETFVFPDSAGPGPQILTAADRAALARLEWDWAIRRGGVIGGPQIIRLQIRGKGDQEVAITRIAAKVVKRSEPVHGWFVQFGGGCGPGVIRIADIDLDSSDPSATDLSSDSGPERLHSLTVTRSDLEQVEVIAQRRGRRRWTVGPDHIACGQIDIGNAATDLTEPMAAGVPQADGKHPAEPRMDVGGRCPGRVLHGRSFRWTPMSPR